MGIDIYAYVEVQNENGSWQLRGGDLHIPRSYMLFGLMGGFGSDKQRGVPPDMSKALAKECWAVHSASWLTSEEFANVVKAEVARAPELTRDHEELHDVLDCMQDAKGRPTRLVFWFD